MEDCSVLRGYHGTTMVDLEDETSHNFNVLVWGGHHVDLIKTENRMYQIRGDKDFLDETTQAGRPKKVSEIKAKAIPAERR